MPTASHDLIARQTAYLAARGITWSNEGGAWYDDNNDLVAFYLADAVTAADRRGLLRAPVQADYSRHAVRYVA